MVWAALPRVRRLLRIPPCILHSGVRAESRQPRAETFWGSSPAKEMGVDAHAPSRKTPGGVDGLDLGYT